MAQRNKVEIKIVPLTTEAEMRRACEMTRKPGMSPSTMTLEKIYRCRHSPARLMKFWIELTNIPTFVSVHLVRHKIGVEHFVESNRDDRGGAGNAAVTRETPVNHGMDINAEAVLNMSLKRLCYAASKETVSAWMKVKKAMRKVDPALSDLMVPACVQCGYCPELKECGPGVRKVIEAYKGAWYVQERKRIEGKL